jgi:hypothetical protein
MATRIPFFLAKPVVLQLGQWLGEGYQTFGQRNLGEYKFVCLFVDGVAVRLRPGAELGPFLAA